MLHGCLFLRQYQGHVAPDLTYMNATLKQHPCHTNSNPGSEAREKPWKNPSSEHTLKIGRRNSGADSIGMKQVPREPGCDTSSQPASEDAAGIYLECCRLWSQRSLDGKQVLPVSSGHGKNTKKTRSRQGNWREWHLRHGSTHFHYSCCISCLSLRGRVGTCTVVANWPDSSFLTPDKSDLIFPDLSTCRQKPLLELTRWSNRRQAVTYVKVPSTGPTASKQATLSGAPRRLRRRRFLMQPENKKLKTENTKQVV